MTTGVAHLEASGNSCRQYRIIPKVPILSSTATSITDVPGVPAAVESGNQACTGNIGALIANATKNATNSQRCVSGPIGSWTRSESNMLGAPWRTDTA